MIIKSVNLETVCGITSTLPQTTKPEFAFAGKSNVGKSSLINGLMNRKSYARTSAQPGKTQTINYYNINDEAYFVDLPGYGYAKVNEKVKEQWGHMIENYLHSSSNLKIIFLLVDIRHEPSKNDKIMYDWMVYYGYQPVVIATKLDKIKRSQIAKQVKLLREGLEMGKESILIPFSAETKQGKEEIMDLIDQVLYGTEEVLDHRKEPECSNKTTSNKTNSNRKTLSSKTKDSKAKDSKAASRSGKTIRGSNHSKRSLKKSKK